MSDESSMDSKEPIFCSYSSADRLKVNGLALLLEALGHKVFMDHQTIRPGRKWAAELQTGLDDADILLVYWTKNSAQSDWVRKEIEYYCTHYPQRLLVPILGDETPLSELLKGYQTSDLFPLVNELLALKTRLEEDGIKAAQIQTAILARLNEAGITIKASNKDKLFRFFAGTGILGLLTAPGAILYGIYNRAIEAVSQLTASQAIALLLALGAGTAACNLSDHTDSEVARGGPSEANSLAGDSWLGRWSGVAVYHRKGASTARRDNFWFEVNRVCNDYLIETNSSENPSIKVVHIQSSWIKFIDGNGIEIDAQHTDSGKGGSEGFLGTPVYDGLISSDLAIVHPLTKIQSTTPQPCS